jgi:protein-disulfide isomerase-like protein with CxxC motif|tara:strand:+ start:184 stop:414 length:231 start_codon:yes stop_codon:yes gene_type:complete
MTNYVITVYRTVQQRADVEFSTDLPIKVDANDPVTRDSEAIIDMVYAATDNIGEREWEEVELDGPYDFDLNEIRKA